MDYEKKYKEALEMARKELQTCGSTDCDAAKQIFRFFPELTESEDDRIRKELIKHLRDGAEGYMPAGNAEDYTRWLFWLEKQGEKPQGKTALKAIHEEKVDNANYVSVKELFSIGDWVVANGTRYRAKIKAFIENDMVEFEDGTFESEENLFKDYHHWTIQDAKDGDILINGSNIFIFHFLNDTRLMGYCHINTDNGRFYDDIGKNECFCLIDAVVNPATKEQRDTLERAMTNAGYRWNKEELKLEKI